MDLKKKIIIMIIALTILIIIILLMIFTNKKSLDEDNVGFATPPTPTIPVQVEETIQKVRIRNNYYAVKNCITKFYTFYTSIYDSDINKMYIEEDAQKQNVLAVYNMLDPEYIKTNRITEENIQEKLKKIQSSVINISNMLVSQKDQDISVYIVDGTLREKKSGKITTFKIMLKLDALNKTFSVFLQDYIDTNYKNLNVGDKIDISIEKNIKANAHNTYTYKHITDADYVKDMLYKYKEEAIFNPDLAYNSLDEEYKRERFGDLEKFKNFIKENSKKYIVMDATQYQKLKKDGYTQYVCVDQNNNYYIFKETSVMDYKLILDTYTIDLPEFIEKYDKATTMEKVGFNIQKCIEAINNKDYSYVYKKLDETFKKSKYKEEEDFIKDIKNNLFDTNVTGKVSSLNEGNTYIYNVNISDKENNNKIKKVTFVMKLKEETDFVMSFSFE